MHITRVVTDIIKGSETTYKLNGVPVYISASFHVAGVDTTVATRGHGFSSELYDLCIAILEDKPGVTVDLKNPDVLFFLKRTKCLQ